MTVREHYFDRFVDEDFPGCCYTDRIMPQLRSDFTLNVFTVSGFVLPVAVLLNSCSVRHKQSVSEVLSTVCCLIASVVIRAMALDSSDYYPSLDEMVDDDGTFSINLISFDLECLVVRLTHGRFNTVSFQRINFLFVKQNVTKANVIQEGTRTRNGSSSNAGPDERSVADS